MHPLPRRRASTAWVLAPVFAVALAVRLTPVLRGGGLYGFVGYDGAVYYAAAAGLAHGLVPYRDFLLLHPPGGILALLPFAALGRLIGDPDAFALARLTWITLGAANAALVTHLLHRTGAGPALVGGLFYALYVPAIYVERNTSLETVASTALLVALWLLIRSGAVGTAAPVSLVAAGVLLGASAGIKIWGAAIALVLVLWTAAAAGRRRSLLLLAGVVGGAVLVCLPFFLAAPAEMWRMVVLDQLGRRRVAAGLPTRLVDIAGLSEVAQAPQTVLVLTLAAVVGVVVVALASTSSLGRLALLLVAVSTALLLVSPSWSVRYAGMGAPQVALLLGTAVAALDQRLHRGRVLAAALVVAGLAGYGVGSVADLSFGRPFPATPVRTALASAPGCVTTDDPTVLIETGALRTNLDAGCRLVVDLGGYSYHLQPAASRRTNRARNEQWQQFVREYLASGSATVVVRFDRGPGFDRTTRALVASWPVLGGTRTCVVRDPGPAPAPPDR